VKKILLAVMVALIVSPLFAADHPYQPTDAERARWTMHDMTSWRVCFDAYKLDHGKYPEVKTVEEARAAFEPVYVLHLPLTDAWGRPYAVESTATTYAVASAGTDGKFDKQSWTTGGALKSFDEDAVITNEGRWLFRHWAMK